MRPIEREWESYPGNIQPEPVRTAMKDAFMAGAAIMFIKMVPEVSSVESLERVNELKEEILAYKPPDREFWGMIRDLFRTPKGKSN